MLILQPRDTRAGYALCADRSLERYRQLALTRRVNRFVPAQP